MVDIHHEGVCDAPVGTAFAFIDDYRQTPSWMFGLREFTPVGGRTHGLGAVFSGTFEVRPVKLRSTVRITEWEQDAVIAFDSINGFRNWSTWRFHADGPTRTRIVVQFSYELPGGLAGRTLGKALEPVVLVAIRQSDQALRHGIEARYRSTIT